MFHAMVRVRISTTVDSERWATARRLVDAPGSQIVDQALAALIDRIERDHEQAVLAAHPYESDQDLTWQAPTGTGLPYDGSVPSDVRELADRRRRAKLKAT